MRYSRLLLLVVAAAAIAGVLVPAAGALTFPDDVCPVRDGTVIKVCPTGETGKAYSYQIRGREGTGCVPEVTFKAIGSLPTGLSMSSGGLISGTPTAPGTSVFWIEMKDIPASEGGAPWCSDNRSTQRQFEITVVQGLQIVQRASVLTPGQVSTPYSLQFTATGGTPTWSVSSGSLPAGITLSQSGLLSGTPTATGDFGFKIAATAGSRTDTQTYSMSVVQKLQLSMKQGASEVGLAYQLAPQATGGKPDYVWSLDGTLPGGLTFNAATGSISGKPTVAGTYAVKLTVKDTLGLTQTVDVPLVVTPKLAITKRPLKAAKVGVPYKARLLATGGLSPRKWNLLGGLPGFLPPGLKLNKRTGELSGTPTKAGVYRLRLQVVDKLGVKSAAGFTLKVGP